MRVLRLLNRSKRRQQSDNLNDEDTDDEQQRSNIFNLSNDEYYQVKYCKMQPDHRYCSRRM